MRVERFFVPASYGDRFIPRRYPKITESTTKVEGVSNLMPQPDRSTDTSFDILALRRNKSYWRLFKFRKTLTDLFELDKDQKLLQLHDRLHTTIPYHTRFNNIDWPCEPRSVPTAFVESTHDLPRFNPETPVNLFAWSSLGVIAAAFNHELVLWSPPSEETACFVMRNITSLAFNIDGQYLATGILLLKHRAKPSDTALKLWRITDSRMSMDSGLLVVGAGVLNAIEWHPTKSFIVVGSEIGSIIVFSFYNNTLEMVFNTTIHSGAVHNVKFSPDFMYVGSVDDNGFIIIWKWSCDGKLTANFKWRSEHRRTYFDWHPWCSGLLVVAEEYGSIAVVQVAGKRILSSYQRDDEKYKINAITFNKISAELVVSCAFVENNGKTVYEIIVLSSLTNIVDRVRNHIKAVRLLAWGPNDTLLATPGDDESLTIWNFFAVINRTKKIELKEANAMRTKSKYDLLERIKCVPEIR